MSWWASRTTPGIVLAVITPLPSLLHCDLFQVVHEQPGLRAADFRPPRVQDVGVEQGDDRRVRLDLPLRRHIELLAFLRVGLLPGALQQGIGAAVRGDVREGGLASVEMGYQ